MLYLSDRFKECYHDSYQPDGAIPQLPTMYDGRCFFYEKFGSTFQWDEPNNTWRLVLGHYQLETPVLSGPSIADEGEDVDIIITNYDPNVTYSISVSGGSYTRSGDTITWTLPMVSSDTNGTIEVYASKPDYWDSETGSHNLTVRNIPVVDDQTLLYEGSTMTSNEFPDTTNIDLTNNTLLATDDNAYAVSEKTSQDAGDNDWGEADPIAETVYKPYCVVEPRTNLEITLNGDFANDIPILLNDGNDPNLFVFDTTGKSTSLVNTIHGNTDPFGDGSLVHGWLLEGDGTDFVAGNDLSLSNASFDGTSTFGTTAVTNDSDDYILTKTADPVNIDTSSFSVSTWFYWDSSKMGRRAFSNRSAEVKDYDVMGLWSVPYIPSCASEEIINRGSRTAMVFYEISTNTLHYIQLDNNGQVSFSVELIGEIPGCFKQSDQWHNVVITGDSSKTKMYIDGVFVNEIDTDAQVFNYHFRIDGTKNYYYSTDYPDCEEYWFFNGQRSETLIFNRALTEDEVKEIVKHRMRKIDISSAGLTNAPSIVAQRPGTFFTSLVATGDPDSFEKRNEQSYVIDDVNNPTKISMTYDSDNRFGRDFKVKVEEPDRAMEMRKIEIALKKRA